MLLYYVERRDWILEDEKSSLPAWYCHLTAEGTRSAGAQQLTPLSTPERQLCSQMAAVRQKAFPRGCVFHTSRANRLKVWGRDGLLFLRSATQLTLSLSLRFPYTQEFPRTLHCTPEMLGAE